MVGKGRVWGAGGWSSVRAIPGTSQRRKAYGGPGRRLGGRFGSGPSRVRVPEAEASPGEKTDAFEGLGFRV